MSALSRLFHRLFSALEILTFIFHICRSPTRTLQGLVRREAAICRGQTAGPRRGRTRLVRAWRVFMVPLFFTFFFFHVYTRVCLRVCLSARTSVGLTRVVFACLCFCLRVCFLRVHVPQQFFWVGFPLHFAYPITFLKFVSSCFMFVYFLSLYYWYSSFDL